ncbi:predicted protein [Lichtheimia corymbifera JMRC:FSU:9682]|uniref:DUF1748-domain-containing protein n=2 Tax=Lichtheimia TaxID=688353 RepID=A0A068RLZ9_9FUNG|nr:uncharacterized protein O0I10_008051 [Lichtheimia ornata]KAI7883021.1 DUF1748-domain-containing protein [Lichtheimia hyalospora FSU 10163]KAJ8656257.1 hypothetical protein O0I10_008051 [Lichtheimia ornata]CDH51208.1 predicted protein [Lichtheimia corymbifera JMRC:FSU:9682]
MWSKFLHLTVDAMLVSTILAGVKRTAGLQPAVSKIPNKDIRGYVEKYLELGEWIFDSTLILMNSSSYFEKST